MSAMTEDEIRAAARHLARARLGGPVTPAPEPALVPGSLAEAYRVQFALEEILDAEGFGPVVGHKIGCTTPVMQAYLNIDHPCAGQVHAGFVHRGEGQLSLADHHPFGLEFEIAATLGADLPASGAPYDRDSVGGALAGLSGALELVEERYHDRPSFPPTLMVADDFFNVGVVLGPLQEAWRDLDLGALRGRAIVDGNLVGEGHGRDILGHPLEALAWLANLRADLGRPLRAGEFVMLGSVVQTQMLEGPARVEADLEGLSRAAVTLVA